MDRGLFGGFGRRACMARDTLRSPRDTTSAALADAQVQARPWVVALLVSLRPAQWTKNLIVFAGLGFGAGDRATSRDLFALPVIAEAIGGFVVFCLLSGVVYIINDWRDLDADRRHPTKSRRPLASGELSPGRALLSAAVIGLAALGLAWQLAPAFFAVAASYVLLLTVYSAGLKHLVILDVLTIAMGFVLRAAAGAVVVGVAISHWLLVLTLLLALFLALGKRRAELITLADGATGHRRILAEYSPALLDQLITIVAGATLLAYAFYTISPDTVAKFGTDGLLFTLPFPLYGIFRYLYLIHRHEGGANPSATLVSDGPIFACVALWAVAVAVVIYGPWR